MRVECIIYSHIAGIFIFSIGSEDNSTNQNDSLAEEEAIVLGFGIPPPPPSYKAAISQKNKDVYKVSKIAQI